MSNPTDNPSLAVFRVFGELHYQAFKIDGHEIPILGGRVTASSPHNRIITVGGDLPERTDMWQASNNPLPLIGLAFYLPDTLHLQFITAEQVAKDGLAIHDDAALVIKDNSLLLAPTGKPFELISSFRVPIAPPYVMFTGEVMLQRESRAVMQRFPFPSVTRLQPVNPLVTLLQSAIASLMSKESQS